MSIKLSFTGDVFLADQPHMVGIGVRSCFNKTKIKNYPFNEIQNYFKKSDIVFGNLESSFIKHRNKFIPKPFSIEPKSILSLKKVKYNVLNLANNHILENGTKSFIFTIKLLKSFNIEVLGKKDNSKKYFTKPVIFDKKDKKLLFLGYSLKQPERKSGIIPYSLANEEKMIRDIKKGKEEEPDIIVVSVHWGDEYIGIPHPENVKLGRNLVDAGADLIIGHHPHVISPIEKYKNSFIIYSLGNFVFDMDYFFTNYGLLVDVTLSNNNELILKPNIIKIQNNWIPKMIKVDFTKLIYSSKKIDKITKDYCKYYQILSINRKNYRISFYKLLVKNLFKNPYYIIPFSLRTIQMRKYQLIKKMKCF